MSRKSGSGFGFILVIITVAIVLILAARNAQQVAPIAQQLDSKPKSVVESNTHGQPEAVDALSDLPNLRQMQQATDSHTLELQETLKQID
jgi:hypothetical protein